MTAYLLDVNVLIALSWPEHLHFALARRWFAKHRDEGWATCPLGQTAFVRIVSNPAFSDRSISVQQAMDGLVNSLRDDQHDFWPDSIAMPEVMRLLKKPVRGHQQFTDAYLVAMAIHKKGKLATLDRGIERWAPAGSVELIRE